MEDLVEGARRPRHVVVDASKRHRVADRVGGRLIRPDVRRNEQRPPGVRVQLAHVLEEVTPRCRRERRGGEHERHVLASVRELLQRPQRVVRIAEGLDPIVVGVPLGELRLDVVESVPILVDGEQDRQAHRSLVAIGVHGRHQTDVLRKRSSEAAQESNLPSDGLRRPAGFEDRIGHQAGATPAAI